MEKPKIIRGAAQCLQSDLLAYVAYFQSKTGMKDTRIGREFAANPHLIRSIKERCPSARIYDRLVAWIDQQLDEEK